LRLFLVVFAAYCYHPQIEAVVLRKSPPKQVAAQRESYTLVGEVKGLDEKLRLATVKHEDIAGWMPAMTMQFPVRADADWKALVVGQRIHATVIVQDMDYYITDVKAAPAGEGATTPGRNP
jgi:Cu/Ag efflux protein CusF